MLKSLHIILDGLEEDNRLFWESIVITSPADKDLKEVIQ